VPLDPGRNWLAAGITGLARQREWDAVATVEGPGAVGDEVEFVALPDGTLVVETASYAVDPETFAGALAPSIEAPYRAVAIRRDDLWAVGARAIEVVRLDPSPDAVDLELTWDGSILSLVSDRMPADPARAGALERLARERQQGSYAARAHRLADDLWEILVLPL
jgi:hypothetical protein